MIQNCPAPVAKKYQPWATRFFILLNKKDFVLFSSSNLEFNLIRNKANICWQALNNPRLDYLRLGVRQVNKGISFVYLKNMIGNYLE